MVSSRVYPDLERAPGKKDNWVEAAGGLPSYIERIAKHLHYERGMTISRAIATAVSRCKVWAAGGDGVTAKTQAKAAKAIAEWEAKKAKTRAKDVAKGDSTLHVIEKGVRRVRTPAGAEFFKRPIGSLITGSVVAEARSRYGTVKTFDMMDNEAGFQQADSWQNVSQVQPGHYDMAKEEDMGDFKYLVSKGKVRRVRTPEGARFFNAPIGTPITPGMVAAARAKHGKGKADAAMAREDRSTPAKRTPQKAASDVTGRGKKDSGAGGAIRRGYGPGAGEWEALKSDLEAAQEPAQADEILDKARRWNKQGTGDDRPINDAELADLEERLVNWEADNFGDGGGEVSSLTRVSLARRRGQSPLADRISQARRNQNNRGGPTAR